MKSGFIAALEQVIDQTKHRRAFRLSSHPLGAQWEQAQPQARSANVLSLSLSSSLFLCLSKHPCLSSGNARVQIKHFALVPQLAPVHVDLVLRLRPWRLCASRSNSLQYLKVPDWERGHACDLGLQLDGQPIPV